MIYAEGMFLCGDIVSQCQVELKETASPARNGCDRVVGRSVCLGEDESVLICVGAPCPENVVSEVNDPVRISTLETDDGERPLHDAGFYILVSGYSELFDHRGLGHSKGIISSLEMVMA